MNTRLPPEMQEQVRQKVAENAAKDQALAGPVLDAWSELRTAMLAFIADARSPSGQQIASRMTSVIGIMNGVRDAMMTLAARPPATDGEAGLNPLGNSAEE